MYELVDRSFELDPELAEAVVARTRDDPSKPWTIAANAAEATGREFDEALDCVRLLTHRGDLMPTADGDIRVDDRYLQVDA